jgi:hypothetical protein
MVSRSSFATGGRLLTEIVTVAVSHSGSSSHT